MLSTVPRARVTEDDLTLYERIRYRDITALAPLIEKHAGRVQVIIRRIIEGYGDRSGRDKEDLAQEVFLKVWQEIDRYDPDKASFTTWINMLAKYVALDFRRQVERENRLLQVLEQTRRAFVEDPVMEIFDKMELEEQLRVFKAAFDKLTADKAQVLIWHYLEGKTYQEIADLTQCPVGTVKARANRARRKLKDLVHLNS